MSRQGVRAIRATFTLGEPWRIASNTHGLKRSTWVSANEAIQLMNESPAAAESRARDVLKSNPHDPQAKCLLAAALITRRSWSEARAILEPLTQTQPQMEFAWRGLGEVLTRTGERAAAISAFERALDLEIRGKDAWCWLGSLTTFPGAGKAPPSGSAEIEKALAEDRVDQADVLSRAILKSHETHPVALKLRADVLIRKSRWPEAKPLLERSLGIAPDFLAARFRYATMLFAHGALAACVPQIDELLRSGCDHVLLRGAKATAFALDGQHASAIAEFERFIGDCECWPGLWNEYGKVLRWNGDRRMSTAFLKAVEMLPSFAPAWYALATVKTFRWSEQLVGEIRNQLSRPDVAIDDRVPLHFVLAKALEDRQHYEEALTHFQASNATLRAIAGYSPKPSQAAWLRTRLLFNPAFVRKHDGAGVAGRDPIFIVGMPRAGSTLVEQILSAHSGVEPLGELTVLATLVENLYIRAGGPHRWPLLLQRLRPADFRALGEEYLRMTRALRKTDAPYFTDKQPNNFQLVGLIHLMLPNARVVDIRRHPLDCGLSCFRHYFPKGHGFACDLADIGQRYVDYVQMMAHFDDILPGKVHRVVYENLVANFEPEVRRLLDYLGLPFEPQCLRFFENRRTVNTLSYEQVFMPLYESGIGQWRRYESWLAPLVEALGPVLKAYPEVPKFFPDVHATSRAPRSLGETGGRFGSVNGLRQRPFASTAA